MDISIVVTSWNTCGLLRTLLASLVAHPPSMPHEIIVVDNGSADGSADMVAREFPRVMLIRNPVNRGYAAANNQGASHATGKYLLLLGSDTEMHAGTIDAMHAYLADHPRVGAVGCKLVNPDGTPQLSVRRFPRLRDAVLTYTSLHRFTGRYTMHGFDPDATLEVDQPAATCLMLRTAALPHGLFDEHYAILYNDVDLCRRLRTEGWGIVYLGSVAVTHVGCSSTSQAGPDLRLAMYRNILRYYRTHAGRPASWVLTPLLALRLCLATGSLKGLELFSPLSKESL